MKIRLVHLLPALVLIAAACAVTPATTTPASSDGAASVAAALREAGIVVEDAGTVEQPFFGVPAHVFTAGGEDVQIYTFASAADAERAAAQVAPSGTTIGTSSMSWMAPPHFFRKDRIVVNYLGSSSRTLEVLQRLLGPQFAGQ